MIIKLTDATESFVTYLENVAEWSYTSNLDRSGQFSFSIPVSDRKSSQIRQKRYIYAYKVSHSGGLELVSGGIIESIDMRYSANSTEWLMFVTGLDLLSELSNTSVGFLKLEVDGLAVDDALEQIMSYAPTGWSLDDVTGYTETSEAVYGQFAGESVLAALSALSKLSGDHFRLGEGRKIVWLQNDTPQSDLTAIQAVAGDVPENRAIVLINALSVIADSYDIVGRIYPYGSGNGESRFGLEATSRSAPTGYTLNKTDNYLQRDATVTEYGLIERYLSYKDIAPISNTDADLESAADTLFDVVYLELEHRAEPLMIYQLSVNKVSQPLHPGEKIRVVYRGFVDGYKMVDIDDELIILQTTNYLSAEGVSVAGLIVSSLPEWLITDEEYLADQIRESGIVEAHPQLTPNTDTLTFRDELDNNKSINLRFWLGSEVTTLNQVKLRFRVDPLRSTVKAVSSESTTTSSGGGSSLTSDSGGSVNTTSGSTSLITFVEPDHRHTETGDLTSYAGSHYHSMSNHVHTVSIGNHSHTVTVPSHTHNVTASVSLSYGIYEDSSANTLAYTDLIFTVNGDTPSASIVSLGSDWYEIDLTAELANVNTKRPSQASNVIIISTTVNKRARVSGQVLIRSTIQAIAAS